MEVFGAALGRSQEQVLTYMERMDRLAVTAGLAEPGAVFRQCVGGEAAPKG